MLKKLFSLLLVACLFTLPTLAFAVEVPSIPGFNLTSGEPAEIEVLEDYLIVAEGVMGMMGTYRALIKNQSPTAAAVYTGTLEGLDKDNNVLFTEQLYLVYPSIIPAGGTGVVQGNYIQVTAEQKAALASWRTTMTGEKVQDEVAPQTVELPVSATYEEVESQDFFTGATTYNGSIMVVLENNTADTLFNAQVLVVLRDEAGKFLGAEVQSLNDIGLYPGAKVALKIIVTRDTMTALHGEGRAIKAVEPSAYVQVETAP